MKIQRSYSLGALIHLDLSCIHLACCIASEDLKMCKVSNENLVFFNGIFKNVVNGGTTYSPLSFSTKKGFIASHHLRGNKPRETFPTHDEVGGITASCQYLPGFEEECLFKPRVIS